jgi:predicted metal-dependent HD superfamily phosphohydrolase
VSDAVRALSWQALWQRLGASGDGGEVLEEIERRYAEPGRHYHTLAHLDACLDVFELVRALCERPDEAELALWLHDVIWTPMGTDNEARSAEWAEALCARAGLAPGMGARLGALILATRHDGSPLAGDAAVVADVDLAILGASPGVFDWYEGAIRREYAALDDEAFRTGRAQFIEALLAREAIYATPTMRDALERRARANLARSLQRLGPANRGGRA